MNPRTYSLIILLLLAVLVLVLIFLPRPSRVTPSEPATTDTSQGRAVTPESSERETEEGSGEEETDDGEETDEGETTSPGTGPIGGNQPIPIQPPPGGQEIPEDQLALTMKVNGVDQPIEQPIVVHDNDNVSCEFHVVSSLSELSYYTITNSAPVVIPIEGELTGNEATIPYRFTYISRLWGPDGSIMVTISTKGRITQTWEIGVSQAGTPGPTGE